MQDRIHLPGRIQLIAGGRYDSLRDHNYSLVATAPCVTSPAPGAANDPCPTSYDSSGNPIYSIPNAPTFSDRGIWLPQYAVTFNPIRSLTLYSNYGVMLSLGPEAPFWADNGSQFLAPFFTRQAEIGAKYEPSGRILLTTAFFRMRAPFFYPQSDGAGGFNFVSEGRETHDGIELNAEGKAANWLRLNASAAAMNATSTDTGTPAFDNKQVINVPHLHSNVFADFTVPRMPRAAPDARLELYQRARRPRATTGERARLQSVQPWRALHARRRAGPRHFPPLRQQHHRQDATGTTPARATATHLSGWARPQRCASAHYTF